MYYMWVKRAYEGGLRLMVDLMVNNEVLCEISYRQAGWSCDDMDAVDRQITRSYELQEFIDGQCQGDECGWYRIVTSPQQAREVIRAGKMAVVLGIEVDFLFGCKPGVPECEDRDWLREKINEYKAKGVQHIVPVHAFDNAFAGPALYRDLFSFANTIATGEAIETWDCSRLDPRGSIGGYFSPRPLTKLISR